MNVITYGLKQLNICSEWIHGVSLFQVTGPEWTFFESVTFVTITLVKKTYLYVVANVLKPSDTAMESVLQHRILNSKYN